MNKKVLIASAAIALLGAGLAGCSSNNSSSNSAKSRSAQTSKKKTAKGTVHETSQSDRDVKKNAGHDGGGVKFDEEVMPISSKKTFKTNFTDKTWPGGIVQIKDVQVYKLKKPYNYESANDGTFPVQGVVKIDMVVSAAKDISIYPTQGTVVLSNGEQADATSDDSWDGDINAGATKNGVATFPVKNLPNVNSLKTVRFKFSGNAQDTDDDSLDRDFDLTINLSK